MGTVLIEEIPLLIVFIRDASSNLIWPLALPQEEEGGGEATNRCLTDSLTDPEEHAQCAFELKL